MVWWSCAVAETTVAAQKTTATLAVRQQDVITTGAAVRAYGVELGRLDVAQRENVARALKAYRGLLWNEPVAQRDLGLAVFRQWHGRLIEAEWKRIEALEPRVKLGKLPFAFDPQGYDEARHMRYERLVARPEERAAGMAIHWSEGDPYPQCAPTFYLEHFGGLVSDAEREFLALESEQLARPAADDAAMLLRPDDWSDRIAAWERYALKYPRGAHAAEARSTAKWYLGFFVNGMPNTEVWDGERGQEVLNADFRRAFERYLAVYAELKSAQVVRRYYEVLKAGAFKRSAASGQALNQLGFDAEGSAEKVALGFGD
jgi:hypothetical protein